MEKTSLIATFYDQDYAIIIGVDADDENGRVQLKEMHGTIVVTPIKDPETGEVNLWPFGQEIKGKTENGIAYEGRIALWDKWNDICPALEKAYLGKKAEA